MSMIGQVVSYNFIIELKHKSQNKFYKREKKWVVYVANHEKLESKTFWQRTLPFFWMQGHTQLSNQNQFVLLFVYCLVIFLPRVSRRKQLAWTATSTSFLLWCGNFKMTVSCKYKSNHYLVRNNDNITYRTTIQRHFVSLERCKQYNLFVLKFWRTV